MSPVRKIFSDFLGLFFPDCCLGCQGGLVRGEHRLCTRCLAELPVVSATDTSLVERLMAVPGLSQAYALLHFHNRGMVRNLLHELKYGHHPDIGFQMGLLLAERLKNYEETRNCDMIIPVPLHRKRLRKRGYNQSACLARGLSRGLGISVMEDVLFRTRETSTQTRKSRFARWLNVRLAFEVRNPARIAGKRIMLCDDVVTTGSTLEACAGELIHAGAGSVVLCCMATAR